MTSFDLALEEMYAIERDILILCTGIEQVDKTLGPCEEDDNHRPR